MKQDLYKINKNSTNIQDVDFGQHLKLVKRNLLLISSSGEGLEL